MHSSCSLGNTKGYVPMDQISGLFKVFHVAHDEIGIKLKQGTKVYAYAYTCIFKGRL